MVRLTYNYRENVHAEIYSLAVLTLVRDPAEQTRLFSSFSSIPSIRAKAEWCFHWIENRQHPFSTRLVAFAAIEGIFFSSSFAAIFWLKSRGLMPGLCHSNELISRDEGLHTNFACLLHSHLREKFSEHTAYTLIREAVVLEQRFFRGMSHPLCVSTITHITNRRTQGTVARDEFRAHVHLHRVHSRQAARCPWFQADIS